MRSITDLQCVSIHLPTSLEDATLGGGNTWMVSCHAIVKLWLQLELFLLLLPVATE